MCLEIGDKVAVLDDVLKGKVMAISGNIISIKTTDGMVLDFDETELVKIEIDQDELSKYSDINHHLLNEKKRDKTKKKKTVFKKEDRKVILEVDLHIHQLVASTKGMDNYDMLSLQIDVAKGKIEYAMKKRIPKIVFIHGVGEGVLKSELQFLLNKYPVKYYDASYQKYGFGATEVCVY